MLSEEEKAKLVELIENASVGELVMIAERIPDVVLLDELRRRYDGMCEKFNRLSRIFGSKEEI